MNGDAASVLLRQLAECTDLPRHFQLAAQLRLTTDGEEIVQLLASVIENFELAKACVAALVRNQDSSKLFDVTVASKMPNGVRRLAFKSLVQLEARLELANILFDPNLPYWLRRRTAEAFYRFSPMNVATALHLRDDFYGKLGRSSNAPRILERKAFLNYVIGDYPLALDLLHQLELKRPPTAWSLEVRGHCLQLLDRTDEAIAVYSSALERDASHTFSRCQRSILYWNQGERECSLADIHDVQIYSAPSWYPKHAGDILRKAGKVDLADAWLDRALLVEPEAADQINVSKGEAQFDRGYFGSAIKFFQAALNANPADAVAREHLAKVFRIGGQFEESVVTFTDLLSAQPAKACWLSARSQVFMRLGKPELAWQDLRAAIKAQDDTWHDYLDALYLAFAGDRGGFSARIDHMIGSGAFSDGNLLEHTANRVVLYAAAGKIEEARRALKNVMEAKEFDCLSYNTIAELDDLATALSDVPTVSTFARSVKDALWPDGCGVNFEPDARMAALKRIQRNRYPFPMYCQKRSIGGLEQDKEFADAILTRAGAEPKTIVIWRIDAAKLYGQCNFKMDEEAEYDLKFCDTVQTVFDNLKQLVQNLGARRLIFLEQDLMDTFRQQLASKRLPAQCSLVDAEWIQKVRLSG